MKQMPEQPAFEGFSERVNQGSDAERKMAYGRWLERLRRDQSDERSTSSADDQPEPNAT